MPKKGFIYLNLLPRKLKILIKAFIFAKVLRFEYYIPFETALLQLLPSNLHILM